MRACLRLVIGSLMSFLGMLGQPSKEGEGPTISKINQAIAWHYRWNANEEAAGIVGRRITVRVLSFGDRFIAFAPELAIAITALRTPSGRIGSVLSVEQSILYSGEIDGVVRNYFDRFRSADSSDCRGRGAFDEIKRRQTAKVPAVTSRLPDSRTCLGGVSTEVLSVKNLAMVVTEVPSIGADTGCSLTVRDLTRSWIERYYPGAPGQMTIPNCREDDPLVFVLVELNNSLTGVLVIRRDVDGKRIAEKLIERRESVARYSSRIVRGKHSVKAW